MTKIIQITAVHGGSSLHEIVYALTDTGEIHRYRVGEWTKLPPLPPQ